LLHLLLIGRRTTEKVEEIVSLRLGWSGLELGLWSWLVCSLEGARSFWRHSEASSCRRERSQRLTTWLWSLSFFLLLSLLFLLLGHLLQLLLSLLLLPLDVGVVAVGV